MNCLSLATLLVLSVLQEPTVPGQERVLDGAIELPNPEQKTSLKALDEERKKLIKELKEARAAGQRDLAKAPVQKVLDDQVAAWNKGDLEGFMAGYWKSDELTFFSGKDIVKGWKATLERYKKRYQSEGKEMGKVAFSDLKIDVLGPDNAVVRGRFKLVTSKETQQGLFTLIF